MVDSSKRKSLMSLGGIMALPFVPSMVSATTGAAESINPVLYNQANSHPVPHIDSDLSIAVLPDGVPVMKVTNTSDELTIVRRIQPGMVSIDGKTYDLNHSLISSAYAISAGKSRLIPIRETSSTASETALTARYGRKHFRVASITSDHGQERVFNAKALFA